MPQLSHGSTPPHCVDFKMDGAAVAKFAVDGNVDAAPAVGLGGVDELVDAARRC